MGDRRQPDRTRSEAEVARLRATRDQLLRAKRAKRLPPDGVEALAECGFRIAVAAGTPADESLSLLREAVRLDGANPKYPYHLARLYLRSGQFDAAAAALQVAVRLCPTSHRLWTHVGVLQRELNARYFGDTRYEPDALRDRADQIVTGVAEGVDAFPPQLLGFTPPVSKASEEEKARQGRSRPQNPTPDANGATGPRAGFRAPPRLTRPKTCRWTGVHDLRVEHLLQAAPTKARLAKLLPLLERAVAAAAERRGGFGGFCILAVLWVVSGYPVATIRRLMRPLAGDWDGPSRRLLDSVCELAEAPPAELPGRLARALEEQTLPLVLVAVLHRRRLLARPLSFRGLGIVRAARRLLAEARQSPAASHDSDATDLARRLLHAVEALFTPPPEELKDEPPKDRSGPARDPAALEAEFAGLERAAVQLSELRTKAFLFLKEDLGTRLQATLDAAPLARAVADRTLFDHLVAALRQVSEQGVARVEAVLEGIAAQASQPPEFQHRQDECLKKFRDLQQLGNFVKALARLDKQLQPLRDQAPSQAGTPTEALAAILAQVRSALPAEPGNSDADAPARLGEYTRQADELAAALERDWVRLRELVAIHKQNNPPLAAAERAEAIDIRGRAEAAFARATALVTELAGLKSSGQVPAAELPACEVTEKRLLGVGERTGPFRRNFVALRLPDGPAAAPSPAQADRGPPPPPTVRTGVEGLAQALEYVDRAIDRCFALAEATFAAYSPAALRQPELRDLRFTVLARKAETWYRLGRRDLARRVWARLLREDRLDAGVLTNLAVCDTLSGSAVQALASWRILIEVLYFFDLVADDPRPHAARRATIHGALGASYAPPALGEKEDTGWEERLDPVAVIAFLSGPNSVRNFVEHKLHEGFNARLQAVSPHALVGVGQSDGRDVREWAMTRWWEFQAVVRDGLPARVRAGVDGLVRRHLTRAAGECGTVRRLKTPAAVKQQDDHKRLLDFVAESVQLRFRLFLMLGRVRDHAGQVSSFAGVLELLRLDLVPYDVSPEMLRAAAARVGLEPDKLRGIVKAGIEGFIIAALRALLDHPTDEADATRRRDLFGRMLAQVVPHPEMKDTLPFIDSPHAYKTFSEKWFPDKSPASMIPVVRRWHAAYPAMAGVAFELGVSLLRLSHTAGPAEAPALEKEASAALEAGARNGFFPSSVEACVRQLAVLMQGQGQTDAALALLEQFRDAATTETNRAVLTHMALQMRFQSAIQNEQHETAVQIGTELLADDDNDLKTAKNFMTVFEHAAKRTRKDVGRRHLWDVITAWAGRAEHRWKKQGDDDEHGDPDALTPVTIERVLAQRDATVVQVVVAVHTDEGEAWDLVPLTGALTELLRDHPELVGAAYFRMLAWDMIAEAAADPVEKEDAGKNAVADARTVSKRSKDAQHKTTAKSILDKYT